LLLNPAGAYKKPVHPTPRARRKPRARGCCTPGSTTTAHAPGRPLSSTAYRQEAGACVPEADAPGCAVQTRTRAPTAGVH